MKLRKPGRPRFKPTPRMRRKVSIWVAGGMSHSDIAELLGISRPTFYQYFDAEISKGARQRRAEVLEALHVSARKGSVAAIREFLKMQGTESPGAEPPAEPVTPRAPAVGKKEQANVDAATAAQGTEWDGLLNPHKPLQ